MGFPGGSDSIESACSQCRRPGFDSWVGKIPGVGNGNPLQYSCLENSMNRGAWPYTGRGVPTSQTRLCMHTQTQVSSFLSTELRVRTKYSTEEICGFCYFWGKKIKLIILS